MTDKARRSLAVGDRVEISIEKGVYRGLGLGRVDGQVVLVPGGLPGDRARVSVSSVRRGYVQAEMVALVQGSEERRTPPCVFSQDCGGCAYQGLELAAQLRLKEAVLRESLSRAGAAWAGEICAHASPEVGWRSRASLHFQEREGRLCLGLQEERTHRVVDVETCLQLTPSLNRVARALHAALQRQARLWPKLVGLDLLEAVGGSGLVAAIEARLGASEATGLVRLAEVDPAVTGLGVVVGGGRYLSLWGQPYVESRVLGHTLRTHIRSFFQANHYRAEDLTRSVIGLVPPGGSVLDLYAGVGLLTLPLADRAAEVVAVEGNRASVEDLRANVEKAGRGNVRVIAGDVLEALAARPAGEGERIVLDPPRTGAGPGVVGAVCARRPEVVVYVSCDPPTLGRDLAEFARSGFRPEVVELFDLFPNTFHLETIVRLRPGV